MVVSMLHLPAIPTQLTSQCHVVVVHQPVNGLELSTNVELLYIFPQLLDRWVLLVTSEDLLCLDILVRAVYIVNSENRKVAVVTEVAEGDASGGLDADFVNGGLGDIEADGHGEEVAISETVVCNDSVESVVLVHASTRCIAKTYPL
jgi:hypothetical protein